MSPEEEFEGVDIGEHGMTAYPDFATHSDSFGTSAASKALGEAVASVTASAPARS